MKLLKGEIIILNVELSDKIYYIENLIHLFGGIPTEEYSLAKKSWYLKENH